MTTAGQTTSAVVWIAFLFFANIYFAFLYFANVHFAFFLFCKFSFCLSLFCKFSFCLFLFCNFDNFTAWLMGIARKVTWRMGSWWLEVEEQKRTLEAEKQKRTGQNFRHRPPLYRCLNHKSTHNKSFRLFCSENFTREFLTWKCFPHSQESEKVLGWKQESCVFHAFLVHAFILSVLIVHAIVRVQELNEAKLAG